MQGRLDQYIAKHHNLSRARAQKLIAVGAVLVNGKAAKASHIVSEKDAIQVDIPPLEKLDIKAEDVPLTIVFEDEHLAVVHKPVGMVTHPAQGNFTGTMVHALLHHIKDLSGIGGVERPGIVHRLDKDTEGLLVVAKTDEAHQKLSQMIKDRKIVRKYVALVKGLMKQDFGTIKASIGRHPKDRKKMAVTLKKAKEAVTHYKVLERDENKNQTRVELTLETGRTHQIRVHLAYFGNPIVGDPLYGRGKGDGQLLCAYLLEFVHPITGKELHFKIKPPF